MALIPAGAGGAASPWAPDQSFKPGRVQMNAAALAAALPQEARKYLDKYIDPADAFLAWRDGLTKKQARSRARNAKRSFGSSWPDRLPPTALIDPSESPQRVEDPAVLIEVVEAASSVTQAEVEAAGVAELLDAIQHAQGAELGRASGLSPRRGQQIRAQQRAALLAGQQDLFAGEEL